MARAFLLIRLTVVMLAGLAAAGVASAAGGDSGRKGNSFTMITSAPAPKGRVVAPAAGTSLAPKSVVRNPNNVPLLQNAGSLRSAR